MKKKTQFGTTIRALRSHNALEYFSSLFQDFIFFCALKSHNALEYFSTLFQDFMSFNGILHESSCPWTPQKNGVVDRKNRHLIQTIRTLLLHANLQLKFWADVVMIAWYLVIRMPSSILLNRTLFSILFVNQKPYHIPSHSIESICFVYYQDSGQDMLAPKAIKCVFLVHSML